MRVFSFSMTGALQMPICNAQKTGVETKGKIPECLQMGERPI
ncbi:hypothetical protein [Acetobacterium bakii]|nr:hypothetical protein [Acetobacterium bakii]